MSADLSASSNVTQLSSGWTFGHQLGRVLRPTPLALGLQPRLAVTLKIERCWDQRGTTIRLIGRIRAEHLEELEKQMQGSESKIALDLEQVNLVDVQVVRFLGTCEAKGVKLLNCSPYINDWIIKERA